MLDVYDDDELQYRTLNGNRADAASKLPSSAMFPLG